MNFSKDTLKLEPRSAMFWLRQHPPRSLGVCHGILFEESIPTGSRASDKIGHYKTVRGCRERNDGFY